VSVVVRHSLDAMVRTMIKFMICTCGAQSVAVLLTVQSAATTVLQLTLCLVPSVIHTVIRLFSR